MTGGKTLALQGAYLRGSGCEILKFPILSLQVFTITKKLLPGFLSYNPSAPLTSLTPTFSRRRRIRMTLLTQLGLARLIALGETNREELERGYHKAS